MLVHFTNYILYHGAFKITTGMQQTISSLFMQYFILLPCIYYIVLSYGILPKKYHVMRFSCWFDCAIVHVLSDEMCQNLPDIGSVYFCVGKYLYCKISQETCLMIPGIVTLKQNQHSN